MSGRDLSTSRACWDGHNAPPNERSVNVLKWDLSPRKTSSFPNQPSFRSEDTPPWCGGCRLCLCVWEERPEISPR